MKGSTSSNGRYFIQFTLHYFYKIYAAYEKYKYFKLTFYVCKSNFDRYINSKLSEILFLSSVGDNGIASMSSISQKKEKRERSHITTIRISSSGM